MCVDVCNFMCVYTHDKSALRRIRSLAVSRLRKRSHAAVTRATWKTEGQGTHLAWDTTTCFRRTQKIFSTTAVTSHVAFNVRRDLFFLLFFLLFNLDFKYKVPNLSHPLPQLCLMHAWLHVTHRRQILLRNNNHQLHPPLFPVPKTQLFF